MNARNSNQQKFSDAGEQAGRVISEFISLADDFSKRFEKEFSATSQSCRASRGDTDFASNTAGGEAHQRSEYENTSGSQESANLENEWRNAGEYLRELREAAGYTVDGFARAMNRQGAARKIKSVEEGRELFPEDWLDQMSALLKQNDPMEFFERLRGLYEPSDTVEPSDISAVNSTHDTSPAKPVAAGAAKPGATSSSVVRKRRAKLQSLFNDDQLHELSDRQFEELLAFVETNFQSALQLVSRK